MTSIADFSRDRDWTPPPTNKSALDVTLGAGDSVSFDLFVVYSAHVRYPEGDEQNLGPYFSETSRDQQVSRALGKGAEVLALYTGKVIWNKESA